MVFPNVEGSESYPDGSSSACSITKDAEERVKKYTSDVSFNYNFEGLPTISLAEVKWCRENPDTASASYDVGVKYYPPEY